MYGIALSVQACLRGGTRVDVAWIVDPDRLPTHDPAEATAITPGGGRLGSLLSGALDGQLIELAGIQSSRGRLAEIDLGPLEAPTAGLDVGDRILCAMVPATELPEDLWPLLLNREPVCLVSDLDNGALTHTSLYTSGTITNADEDAARAFGRGSSSVQVGPDAMITVLWPRPTVLIVGGGELAEALSNAVAVLGWQPTVTNGANQATGLVATLAPIDAVVVMGHDLETVGRVMAAALAGDVGYIGSIGPRSLQDTRADWLAYRGLSDLTRVSGPAGLDIGARTPQEVAVAVVAEIISFQTGSKP
jgi:xanthine dehydrogenase accessory factor